MILSPNSTGYTTKPLTIGLCAIILSAYNLIAMDTPEVPMDIDTKEPVIKIITADKEITEIEAELLISSCKTIKLMLDDLGGLSEEVLPIDHYRPEIIKAFLNTLKKMALKSTEKDGKISDDDILKITQDSLATAGINAQNIIDFFNLADYLDYNDSVYNFLKAAAKLFYDCDYHTMTTVLPKELHKQIREISETKEIESPFNAHDQPLFAHDGENTIYALNKSYRGGYSMTEIDAQSGKAIRSYMLIVKNSDGKISGFYDDVQEFIVSGNHMFFYICNKNDNFICILDINTFTIVRLLGVRKGSKQAMVFNPKIKTLFISSFDGGLRAIDLNDLNGDLRFESENKGPIAMKLHDGIIYVANYKIGTIDLFDADIAGRYLASIIVREKPTHLAVFNNHLYICYENDYFITIINLDQKGSFEPRHQKMRYRPLALKDGKDAIFIGSTGHQQDWNGNDTFQICLLSKKHNGEEYHSFTNPNAWVPTGNNMILFFGTWERTAYDLGGRGFEPNYRLRDYYNSNAR